MLCTPHSKWGLHTTLFKGNCKGAVYNPMKVACKSFQRFLNEDCVHSPLKVDLDRVGHISLSYLETIRFSYRLCKNPRIFTGFWLTTECWSRAYAIMICLSSSSSVSTPPDHMLGQIRFILCMHMHLYPV